MRSGLVFLVGLPLALCTGLVSARSPLQPRPSTGKPGNCPKRPPVGHCVDKCSSDVGCPRNLKCCSNGCGHTCQSPIFHVKPGECPQFKIPPGLPCNLECWQDGDCLGTQRCCPKGCSKVCFAAGLASPPDSQA